MEACDEAAVGSIVNVAREEKLMVYSSSLTNPIEVFRVELETRLEALCGVGRWRTLQPAVMRT